MPLNASSWETDGTGALALIWVYDSMACRFMPQPRGALLVFCVECWTGLASSAALGAASFQWNMRWEGAQRFHFLLELGHPPLWPIPRGYTQPSFEVSEEDDTDWY